MSDIEILRQLTLRDRSSVVGQAQPPCWVTLNARVKCAHPLSDTGAMVLNSHRVCHRCRSLAISYPRLAVPRSGSSTHGNNPQSMDSTGTPMRRSDWERCVEIDGDPCIGPSERGLPGVLDIWRTNQRLDEGCRRKLTAIGWTSTRSRITAPSSGTSWCRCHYAQCGQPDDQGKVTCYREASDGMEGLDGDADHGVGRGNG